MPNQLTLTSAFNLSDADLMYTPTEELRAVRAEAEKVRSSAWAEMTRIADVADGREMTRSQKEGFDAAEESMQRHAKLVEQLDDVISRKSIDYSGVVDTGSPDPNVISRNGRWTTGSEPATYRQGDPRRSYLRDLHAFSATRDAGARDRLNRNNREVSELRALSSAATEGGEFAPPRWLMEQSAHLSRAGRVIADQVTKMELAPNSGSSIEVPRITSGPEISAQSAENTTVANTDMEFDSVEGRIHTLAGMQVVSWQLLQQSTVPVDELILTEMFAELAKQVDRFLLTSNATGKVGILNVSGRNTVTYTDASPSAAELHPKIADAVTQIHTARFMPATRLFMHPRRWGWLTAQVDTTGRPLVVPAAQAPMNAIAAPGAVAAEGYVGSMAGLPVFVDANLPTNGGAGTNEDVVVACKAEDIVLAESTPAMKVLNERYADQLSVGFVLAEMLAVLANRFPKSISVISGTGLITPSF